MAPEIRGEAEARGNLAERDRNARSKLRVMWLPVQDHVEDDQCNWNGEKGDEKIPPVNWSDCPDDAEGNYDRDIQHTGAE